MIRVVVVVRVHRFRAWEVVAVCPLVFLVAPSLAQEAQEIRHIRCILQLYRS